MANGVVIVIFEVLCLLPGWQPFCNSVPWHLLGKSGLCSSYLASCFFLLGGWDFSMKHQLGPGLCSFVSSDKAIPSVYHCGLLCAVQLSALARTVTQSNPVCQSTPSLNHTLSINLHC